MPGEVSGPEYPFPKLVLTEADRPSRNGSHVLVSWFLRRNPADVSFLDSMSSRSADAESVATALMLGISASHVRPLSPRGSEGRIRSGCPDE